MPLTKYTESSLTPDERILYAGRGHNWSFVSSLIIVGIAIIMLFPPPAPDMASDSSAGKFVIYYVDLVKIKFTEFLEGLPAEMQPFVQYILKARSYIMGLLFLVIGLFLLMRAVVKKLSVEKVITNRKIIYKKGLVEVDESEIPLNHIEGVKVKQTAFDRMINRGTILVTGIGMEQIEVKKVADPNTFRKQAYMAVDVYEKEKHQRAALASSIQSQRTQSAMNQQELRHRQQMQQQDNQQRPQQGQPQQRPQTPPQHSQAQRPPQQMSRPTPPPPPAPREPEYQQPQQPVYQPEQPASPPQHNPHQHPEPAPAAPQTPTQQTQPQQPPQAAQQPPVSHGHEAVQPPPSRPPVVNSTDHQAPTAPAYQAQSAPQTPFNNDDIPPVASKWPRKDKTKAKPKPKTKTKKKPKN